MIEKIEGIIISEQNYGETSKILNVMTKNFGIIGVMAKGVKKIKSPFFNKTTKFTYAEFNIKYKKGKISTLISIDVKDYFKNIKLDIEKITYASIITELIAQIYNEEINVEIYNLYLKALKKIDDGFSGLGMSNIVKLKLLAFLGVSLKLDSCCICNSKKDIVTLSCNNGGYICKKCYNNEKLVSESAIKLIRIFYYIDINNITKFEIQEKTLLEIKEFLDEYYEIYTGIYLKSSKFLNILERLN